MSRISVIGSGAWGTAIALRLHARGDHRVTLWSHNPAVAETIRANRENAAFLPGFAIPDDIVATADLQQALTAAEIVISAMPSAHVRDLFGAMAPHLRPEQAVVSATKGIEDGTHLRVTEIIAQVLGARGLSLPLAVLSGPSFAREVAAGRPTAVTIAAPDTALASRIQSEFSSHALRLYTNDDVVGVELGGALKNVIAIATGIVDRARPRP